MKWQRFLLLLLLVPSLVYASSYDGWDYNADVGVISGQWSRHNELVQEFNRLKREKNEQNIDLLRESLACCQRAIALCEHILKKIGEKSTKEQKSWKDQKKQTEQDKNTINTEIGNLQILIDHTLNQLKELAFSKANYFFRESEKKVRLAVLKNRDCTRRLNNIEEVISTLNDICKLYEEAFTLASDALNLISPYPDEESKDVLNKAIVAYKAAADKYRKEAEEWPTSVAAKKTAFKEEVATLKQDSKLFTEKGLKRGCYELQKQAMSILEQLIESSSSEEVDALTEELEQLRTATLIFEKEADHSRLTYSLPVLSQEEFRAREKERKELFFKSDFFLHPDLFLPETFKDEPLPRVISLDGQMEKENRHFALYTEQFYRFLVQSESAIPEIFVAVSEHGQVIHVEKISLPFRETLGWENYLKNGMILIPETKLKSEFGLDLRLSFSCDSKNQFSMIVAQKSANPRSHNYASSRDIVTRLDVVGKLKYGNELQTLKPHPNANFWDHEFLSPTFAPILRDHIVDYIENYGGKK